MNGYTYSEPEPKARCPYCQAMCCADFVDIGVGMQQCGPYHCEACGASEIGTFDEPRELTAEEERTGWYGPNGEPGSTANVIYGRHATSQEVNKLYRQEFTGNPLWHDKAYLDDWWKAIRKV